MNEMVVKMGAEGHRYTDILLFISVFLKLLTVFFFHLIRQEQRDCNARVHRPGGAAEKKIWVQRLTSNHDRKLAALSAG